MNGNSVLLDTNLVLYLLLGDEDLSTLLYNKKLYVSFVTQLELLGYQDIEEHEQQEIRNFLEDCVIIDINNRIKEEVIRIKQSGKIKLPDSIILATSKYWRSRNYFRY
ncbi:type II toxin-antitoxin system VapC family toxin [Echinicola soli]|uniref:Type II toxin-antitoxin system VapC family toxin n=1 Tax=Echinicola soli TaxID=2591634 RepID=A0A514CF55_9BACT|nr:PIN domain-containing protein [Echinicola soli]QDH78449.1 type II toxin-antitoxin system VapC family toxin [Echinicola soli]